LLTNSSTTIHSIISTLQNEPFICIHMRRGDYLNVASHVVNDDDFINIACNFSHLLNKIIVLSDSKIQTNITNYIELKYKNSHFLDSIDAFSAHCIMRQASILICSNSQFSLSAALLNKKALIVVPSQWFGGKDRVLETSIHSRCRFQFFSNT